MNRRILAVIIAVLLAVGGAALVLVYAKNADKRAIAAAQPSTVWVAEKLVPAGTTLKDAERTELIAKTQVAAAAVPQGALQDVNADNNALLALSDIQPGEYLLSARFGSTPVGTKAIEVPSGKVAVSSSSSDPARVGTLRDAGLAHRDLPDLQAGQARGRRGIQAVQRPRLPRHQRPARRRARHRHGGDSPQRPDRPARRLGGGADGQATAGAELPRHRRRDAGAVGQAGARHQHLHAVCRPAWLRRQVPGAASKPATW